MESPAPLTAGPMSTGWNLGEPLLSVVIPVRGRQRELRRLLVSLAYQQNCPNDRIEVVIVDNPHPLNESWLRSTSWPFSLRYEYVPTANRGLSRNVGARTATGGWLLFIDSDIVLTRTAVAKLLRTRGCASGSLIMADVSPLPGQPRSHRTQLLDVPAYFRSFRRSHRKGQLTFREFVSCAFLVRRDLHESIDGV